MGTSLPYISQLRVTRLICNVVQTAVREIKPFPSPVYDVVVEEPAPEEPANKNSNFLSSNFNFFWPQKFFSLLHINNLLPDMLKLYIPLSLLYTKIKKSFFFRKRK